MIVAHVRARSNISIADASHAEFTEYLRALYGEFSEADAKPGLVFLKGGIEIGKYYPIHRSGHITRQPCS